MAAVRNPPPSTPPPAASIEPADLVEHRVWVQVAPPTDTDPGAIIEGIVRVHDADGNLLGTEQCRRGRAPSVA
jgi:hypothetical protein